MQVCSNRETLYAPTALRNPAALRTMHRVHRLIKKDVTDAMKPPYRFTGRTIIETE